MQKHEVIFGLRDFARPRGEGFLYYKLAPNYREQILIEYNLYITKPAELMNIYTKGIKKFIELEQLGNTKKTELLSCYDTENMQPWAREILDNVLKKC